MYHIAKLSTVEKPKGSKKVIVISDWIDQSTKTCFYPPKNADLAVKLNYKAGKKWIKYQCAILGSYKTWEEAQAGLLKRITTKASIDGSVPKESTYNSTSQNNLARVEELHPSVSEVVEADPLGRGKREKIRKTVFSPVVVQPKKINVASKEIQKETKKSLRPFPRTPLGLLDRNQKENNYYNNHVEKESGLHSDEQTLFDLDARAFILPNEKPNSQSTSQLHTDGIGNPLSEQQQSTSINMQQPRQLDTRNNSLSLSQAHTAHGTVAPLYEQQQLASFNMQQHRQLDARHNSPSSSHTAHGVFGPLCGQQQPASINMQQPRQSESGHLVNSYQQSVSDDLTNSRNVNVHSTTNITSRPVSTSTEYNHYSASWDHSMNEFSEQLHNRPYSANTFPDNNYSLNREEAVPHEPATNVGGFSSSEMRASGIPRIESQTTNKKSLKRDFAQFLQKLESIQANQLKQGDEIRAIHQKLSDDGSSTRTDGENVLRLPVQTALEFDELEDMMEDENVQKQLRQQVALAGGDTQQCAVKLAWEKVAHPNVLMNYNWCGIKRTDRDKKKTGVKGRKTTQQILLALRTTKSCKQLTDTDFMKWSQIALKYMPRTAKARKNQIEA